MDHRMESLTARLMKQPLPHCGWKQVPSSTANSINWTFQTNTQQKGYFVECLMRSTQGTWHHQILDHLCLKEKLRNGWQLLKIVEVVEFDLQKWLKWRAAQFDGVNNFYHLGSL